jgi:predicted DNA-binding transcriptional regulator AlpA
MLTTPLLNQDEAAKALRLSTRTLERLRLQGGGPQYVKMRKRVLYRANDIEAWIAEHLTTSTSAVEAARS